ncbi:MAG: hypothetical protein IH851_11330 [Armatimonadetes bacterium]|nr:hypothetical protein [Armatimonadota bacterium]
MSFEETSKRLGRKLQESVPKEWDGRKAILELKEAGTKYWKQMEWIGFYFQYLCETHLPPHMTVPGPRYGNVGFDGLCDIAWDFKAHAINTSSHQVIVNDSAAIAEAIKDDGAVGVILALGEVVYNDDERTFKAWHDELKGDKSKYEIERIRRGAWSRLRKVFFDLKQISFIRITDDTLVKCGSFQGDFRNADGSPRREKVLLDLEKLEEDLIYFVEFD